jgi:hypothetical protein
LKFEERNRQTGHNETRIKETLSTPRKEIASSKTRRNSRENLSPMNGESSTLLRLRVLLRWSGSSWLKNYFSTPRQCRGASPTI